MQGSGLLEQLKAASTDAKAPGAREGAFVAYGALAAGAPRLAEPYLVPLLDTILDKCSDKVNLGTRSLVLRCSRSICSSVSCNVLALMVDLGSSQYVCFVDICSDETVSRAADHTSARCGRGSWQGIDAEHQRVCHHGGASYAARGDGAQEAVANQGMLTYADLSQL